MLHLKIEVIAGEADRQSILKTVFKTKESIKNLRVVSVMVQFCVQKCSK